MYIDPSSDAPGVTMIVVQVNEDPAMSNRIAGNDLIIHPSTLKTAQESHVRISGLQ
jgi:hypothetical protein